MEKEIVVVTAFFAINRESWKGFSRSNDLYFEYFKGWAKLKNRLIVYVEDEELKNKILSFRSEWGLEDKTIVNIVPDIMNIDRPLVSSMEKASSNPVHKLYRLFPKNPECWNATYDYIMLLKAWCCADAVEKGQAASDDMVAWLDFGLNHGGEIIDINSDFNFTWKYDFPDKINFFLIQPLDERPLFDIILSMDTYIMGMTVVGSGYLWGTFWNMLRDNMTALNKAGLIDDDQNVMLMCLRERPELFNTYLSSWQKPIVEFGGTHLKFVPVQERGFLYYMRKKYRRLRYKVKVFKYSMGLYSYLSKRTVH